MRSWKFSVNLRARSVIVRMRSVHQGIRKLYSMIFSSFFCKFIPLKLIWKICCTKSLLIFILDISLALHDRCLPCSNNYIHCGLNVRVHFMFANLPNLLILQNLIALKNCMFYSSWFSTKLTAFIILTGTSINNYLWFYTFWKSITTILLFCNAWKVKPQFMTSDKYCKTCNFCMHLKLKRFANLYIREH